MAIYHLSAKTISRSDGRSATAAIAYRSGDKVIDERTGEVHDYTKKSGVVSSVIFNHENAPEWASDRNKLWNEIEKAETRKNSTVAREFEIALPAELSEKDREKLAHNFTKLIVDRYQVAAECSIHEPGKGDDKNHHAHILVSTRRLTKDGFTEKTRELDTIKDTKEIDFLRSSFADMQNELLAANNIDQRVSHESFKKRGIDREPTSHLGPAVSEMKRKGKKSHVLERIAGEREEALLDKLAIHGFNTAEERFAIAEVALKEAEAELKRAEKYAEFDSQLVTLKTPKGSVSLTIGDFTQANVVNKDMGVADRILLSSVQPEKANNGLTAQENERLKALGLLAENGKPTPLAITVIQIRDDNIINNKARGLVIGLTSAELIEQRNQQTAFKAPERDNQPTVEPTPSPVKENAPEREKTAIKPTVTKRRDMDFGR